MTAKTRAALLIDLTEDIAPNRRQAITASVLRANLMDIVDSALLQNESPTAGTMGLQDADSVDITGGSISGISPPIPISSGGTGAITASLARTAFGLVISTDVQAYDANLTTWGAKTVPSGTVLGDTDTQTLTGKTFDAALNTLSGVATAHFAASVVDTDTTLAADSDSRLATQKAVRAYVANAILGTQWKTLSIVAVAVANVTQSGEQTIDGVLTSASRVLCVAQTDPLLNGAWVTAAGAWARATDSDVGAELFHAAYFVADGGTIYGNSQWACTNATEPTVGVSNLTFAQIGGAVTYRAGTGLSLTGNTFAISDAELLAWSAKTAPAGIVVGLTDVQTLTNKTIAAGSNTVSGLTTSMFAANVVDTSTTLAANSDTRLASQKATKAYVDAQLAAGSGSGSLFATLPTTPASTIVSTGVVRVGVLRHEATSEYRFTGYIEVSVEPDHDLKFQAADGRWFEIEDSRVDIRSAGARKASATNTAAVQRALDTGRSIYIPGFADSPEYCCENTIFMRFSGQVIFGDGKEQSILEFSHMTNNCVEINGDPTSINAGPLVGCGMQNIGLRHTGSPGNSAIPGSEAGAMIRCNRSNRMLFFGLQLKNGYDHVHLSGCSFNDFISCWHFGPQRTTPGGAIYRITQAVVIPDDPDVGKNTNNNFYGCDGLSTSSVLDAAGTPWMAYGFHIEECDGVNSQDCHFNRVDVVINIQPADGQNVGSLWFGWFYCDSSYTRALWIRGGGAASIRYTNLKFDHCHFRDAVKASSVLIEPEGDLLDIEFTSCFANNNLKNSFRAVADTGGSIKNLTIDGFKFGNNNRDDVAATSEVFIEADGFNVRGCESVYEDTGIHCDTFITANANCLNGIVECNDASANPTWDVAPFVDNSTSPTVVFQNNKDAQGQMVAVTAARTLLRSENGKRFTNEGATARVDFTLPSVKRGLVFKFLVQDNDDIRVIAAGGDTIRNAGSVSAAAGRIDATAIGAAVRLEGMNATEWFVTAAVGTWTVT